MPAKDRKYRWLDSKIICPRYKDTAQQKIRCDGAFEGHTQKITFNSRRKYEEFAQEYCCDKYYKCPYKHNRQE